MVNEEKQIFHCFGCGEGGDVFAFLMKMGHFFFPRHWKSWLGISGSNFRRDDSQPREMAKREALFRINQIASDYFHDLLTQQKEKKQGDICRAGGSGRRSFRNTGWVIPSIRWDGLVHSSGRKRFLWRWLLNWVWSLQEKEGWYDAFRGRVVFPCLRPHPPGHRLRWKGDVRRASRVCGQVPESAIYHKGQILYGLPSAKQWIQEKRAP